MQRLVSLLLILGATVAWSSCVATTLPSDAIAHDVFLSLKNPSRSAIAGLTQDCRKLLAIPGVLHLDAGPRASAMTRADNDQDFHVAMHVVFSNHGNYERYRVHPLHKALIARWKEEFAEIRVFDYHVGGNLQR